MGTSTNGIGVQGVSSTSVGVVGSGATGVQATATTTGVFGEATNSGSAGVVGQSPGYGIIGEGGPDNIYANGTGGNLFRGNNSAGTDVFIVTNAGNTTIGGALAVNSGIATGADVVGFGGGFFGASSAMIGVFGQGSTEGVEGLNSTTGDAIYANGLGGYLFRGNNSHSQDVFLVDDGGNVFANTFTGGLAETTVQRTASGQNVLTYSAQATQPTIDDVGEAQLVDGVAHVPLDPGLAAAIDRRSNYVVLVTPEGLTRGTLCVTQRTPAGFTVEENMGGRSTVPFAYRLVARPYGSNAARLPAATRVPASFDRPNGSKHVPAMHKLPPLVHHKKVLFTPIHA